MLYQILSYRTKTFKETHFYYLDFFAIISSVGMGYIQTGLKYFSAASSCWVLGVHFGTVCVNDIPAEMSVLHIINHLLCATSKHILNYELRDVQNVQISCGLEMLPVSQPYSICIFWLLPQKRLHRDRVLTHQQQWAGICWIPLGLFAAML